MPRRPARPPARRPSAAVRLRCRRRGVQAGLVQTRPGRCRRPRDRPRGERRILDVGGILHVGGVLDVGRVLHVGRVLDVGRICHRCLRVERSPDGRTRRCRPRGVTPNATAPSATAATTRSRVNMGSPIAPIADSAVKVRPAGRDPNRLRFSLDIEGGVLRHQRRFQGASKARPELHYRGSRKTWAGGTPAWRARARRAGPRSAGKPGHETARRGNAETRPHLLARTGVIPLLERNSSNSAPAVSARNGALRGNSPVRKRGNRTPATAVLQGAPWRPECRPPAQ